MYQARQYDVLLADGNLYSVWARTSSWKSGRISTSSVAFTPLKGYIEMMCFYIFLLNKRNMNQIVFFSMRLPFLLIEMPLHIEKVLD